MFLGVNVRQNREYWYMFSNSTIFTGKSNRYYW